MDEVKTLREAAKDLEGLLAFGRKWDAEQAASMLVRIVPILCRREADRIEREGAQCAASDYKPQVPPEIQIIVSRLVEKQEPLGADFEHVWDQNTDKLYEHDSTPDAIKAAEDAKNNAYAERDRLVAALSKLFPSRLERHSSQAPAFDDEWQWVVRIDLPAGQAGWHIHNSELPWFDHLKRFTESSWDGHSTEEKYARLAALEPK